LKLKSRTQTDSTVAFDGFKIIFNDEML